MSCALMIRSVFPEHGQFSKQLLTDRDGTVNRMHASHGLTSLRVEEGGWGKSSQ